MNEKVQEQENGKKEFIQGGHDYAFCPECGSPVAHESGCVVCYNCGWSMCG